MAPATNEWADYPHSMKATNQYTTLTIINQPFTCYVPALTGLRAMAAYLVFLHHYNPAIPGTVAYSLFKQSYTGVSIFFVLSGFLLYHRYAQAYCTQIDWSWRTFIGRRIARVYPLYLLLFLLTAGVQAVLRQPMTTGLFWLNSTLLKGLFNSLKFSGIAQSWSLTVELCFYAAAPFLFTGLQRWGVLRLTAGLFGAGLLIGFISTKTLTTESLSFIAFYTFFGRGFEFVLGMNLARRWQESSIPFISNASQKGFWMILGCISWQALLSLLVDHPLWLLISELFVYNCLLPIGISLLVLGLVQQKTFLGWLLAHPFLQALGRSSYAFYLIHIGLVASGLQKAGLTNRWLLFGSLIGIAYGLYHIVERPAYHYLIRRSSTR